LIETPAMLSRQENEIDRKRCRFYVLRRVGRWSLRRLINVPVSCRQRINIWYRYNASGRSGGLAFPERPHG
jgi:hypothetical protein